jgi:hypothetical protein
VFWFPINFGAPGTKLKFRASYLSLGRGLCAVRLGGVAWPGGAVLANRRLIMKIEVNWSSIGPFGLVIETAALKSSNGRNRRASSKGKFTRRSLGYYRRASKPRMPGTSMRVQKSACRVPVRPLFPWFAARLKRLE